MTQLPDESSYLPPVDLDRLRRNALLLGLLGAAVSIFGAFTETEQFTRSYLVAWLYWLGIAIGCFAILMLHHLTRGAWGLMVRRVFEAASRTIPLLGVLFLPVALRLSDAFSWARPDAGDDPLIAHKEWFLNPPFFYARAVTYFAIWILFAFVLGRLSLRQDRTGNPALFRRMQTAAGPGIVLLALTGTLASIDWLMSLDPHWYSSLFGFYFLAGQVVAGMAFTIVIVRYLSDREPLESVFTAQHYHDYGNLLMAFILLWSYFALSQLLIIWSGNLSEETVWYLERVQGPWRGLAVALGLLHFVVPFFLLLSRHVKRHIKLLVRIAFLVLAVRFVDLYWLAAPTFEHGHFPLHWLDLGTLVGLGGLWTAAFVHQLKKRSLLPIQDPYLEEALDG
jgi:hypothetical protein